MLQLVEEKVLVRPLDEILNVLKSAMTLRSQDASRSLHDLAFDGKICSLGVGIGPPALEEIRRHASALSAAARKSGFVRTVAKVFGELRENPSHFHTILS